MKHKPDVPTESLYYLTIYQHCVINFQWFTFSDKRIGIEQIYIKRINVLILSAMKYFKTIPLFLLLLINIKIYVRADYSERWLTT